MMTSGVEALSFRWYRFDSPETTRNESTRLKVPDCSSRIRRRVPGAHNGRPRAMRCLVNGRYERRATLVVDFATGELPDISGALLLSFVEERERSRLFGCSG